MKGKKSKSVDEEKSEPSDPVELKRMTIQTPGNYRTCIRVVLRSGHKTVNHVRWFQHLSPWISC